MGIGAAFMGCWSARYAVALGMQSPAEALTIGIVGFILGAVITPVILCNEKEVTTLDDQKIADGYLISTAELRKVTREAKRLYKHEEESRSDIILEIQMAKEGKSSRQALCRSWCLLINLKYI